MVRNDNYTQRARSIKGTRLNFVSSVAAVGITAVMCAVAVRMYYGRFNTYYMKNYVEPEVKEDVLNEKEAKQLLHDFSQSTRKSWEQEFIMKKIREMKGF